ncbi:hypothetical protein [Kordiimonas aquimaris]|uniref:hypothetical protein n=1 Tax=Kordiimonas aquimaris TaxID=707591 RepID=UPI0021D184F8|nr:hypothetical protein [Kordiimonas aquimaris]
MLKKIALIITFTLTLHTVVVAQNGGLVERLTNSYEQTQDLAIAYHLARITFALEQYSETVKWLSVLQKSDWKMGIDAPDFTAKHLTSDTSVLSEIQTLVKALNATRIPQSDTGMVSHAMRIDDPMLVPENIAYDSEKGVLYAGSLVEPRIVRVHMNNASMNDDMPLADNVNWGVIYGMKYHDERRELWVLHNRRDGALLRGALTVLNDDGQAVKTYKTSGEQPVELNDLCFTRENVYITDSTASKIYKGSVNSDVLALFYADTDINYPNGIACDEGTDTIFVSDSRGVSTLKKENPVNHQRLISAKGVSFGGIDGLYLSNETLVGVQNYLGILKVLTLDISEAPKTSDVKAFDVDRPEFRVPTTGFVHKGCLYYIANSSLDAIGQDGSIDPDAEQPKPAKVIALNIAPGGSQCLM